MSGSARNKSSMEVIPPIRAKASLASTEDIGFLLPGHTLNLRAGERRCLTGGEAADGGRRKGVDLVSGECRDQIRAQPPHFRAGKPLDSSSGNSGELCRRKG